MRGNVEGGVIYVDFIRGEFFTGDSGYFLGRALFDRNLGAVSKGKVKRAGWGGDIKWYIMGMGQYRQRVRPYFIRSAPVMTRSILEILIRWPAMLSQIKVVSIPA